MRAPFRAALHEAVDEDGRIHGAGRRAGDAVDAEPGFLEEAIKHAPREGAVGSTTLQGKIDQDGFSTLADQGAGTFLSVTATVALQATGGQRRYARCAACLAHSGPFPGMWFGRWPALSIRQVGWRTAHRPAVDGRPRTSRSGVRTASQQEKPDQQRQAELPVVAELVAARPHHHQVGRGRDRA